MRVFPLTCSQARFSYRVTVSNMEHMVTLQTLIIQKTPQNKTAAHYTAHAGPFCIALAVLM